MAPASIERTVESNAATRIMGRAEEIRRELSGSVDPQRRGLLGQFTTPPPAASFMSSLFSLRRQHIRLLDPGAGTGALTAAFVAHQVTRGITPKAITVTAYEVDPHMAAGLIETFRACEQVCSSLGVSFAYNIRQADYIRDCADLERSLWSDHAEEYDVVIMNPPYHKINSDSTERKLLRSVGIEVTNLYAAFMLLAARQLAEGGEFVSITPRSFCNGPYFKRFRREFLDLIAINRVHVYESRSETFKEDDVLQENVIVYGVRGGNRASGVTISKTTAGGGLEERSIDFDQVVRRDDSEQVIHIITDDQGDAVSDRMLSLRSSLDGLGFAASTGRVVDFRAREHLRDQASADSAPLIFPAHMKEGKVVWPNGQMRKPNAIVVSSATKDLLVESGYYVLIKRFSAKEERRRVVAALYDPGTVAAPLVGFDNKTNYIHASGNGLPREEAVGLTIFLNSSLVDQYFRLFSGHTQVNAADLKRLPYPTRPQLQILANTCQSLHRQQQIDRAVEAIVQSSSRDKRST